MAQSSTLDVGMAVHQESMAGASVAQDHGAEVVSLGTIGTWPCDSDQRLRQLRSKSTPRVCVYEAGPCGSWRSRSLLKQGDVCWGVAPALMPKQAGDRVNTDRRDARPRARLMRSGDLTPGYVPAVDEEAIRDLQAAKLPLKAFWRRHDSRSTGRATWSPAHRRWLREVVCPTPAPPMVFQAYVQTVTDQTARLRRLEHARHEPGQTWRFPPVVEALQAWCGVPCTVAVTTVADLGDLTRVDNPRQLMHDLGLTPSDYSRGAQRQQGRLTKTGQTHARRALVAGAWAYR